MNTPLESQADRGARLVELIDAVAPGPIIVSGSPPGEGGDLDLLMRPGDREIVGEALDRAGFLNRGRMWARFEGTTVDAVELFTTDEFRLPDDEVDSLVVGATPIRPEGRLAMPGPVESLLLLALRYSQRPGQLADRHRSRVDEAIRRDPAAWSKAQARAGAWHVAIALDAMRATYEGAPPATSGRRATRRGAPAGAVIALSGLDGSGKSTQASLLRDNLDRLGYKAVVVWSRLEWDTLVEGRSLALIATPVKVALRLAARLRGQAAAPPKADEGEHDGDRETARGAVTPYRRPADAASALRQRSPVLTGAWVTVVALVHALTTRRRLAGHLREGTIVISDRYVLDTVVFLRFIYGEDRGFRLARRVLTTVSPRSVATWFLDVDASTALARKPDEFDAGELNRLRALYRDTAPAVGAIRLDGTQGQEDLAPLIGLHSWWSLA